MPIVSVQAADFDLAQEMAEITQGHSDIGGIVSFVGLCRDEGGTLRALELEHYPGMAESEISRVAEQAQARWPLLGLRIIHRYGKVAPGDQIVLVVAASAHRAAAFSAADFLMDYLKTRAPFWKKEHRLDGTTGDWVAPKAADDAAADRWNVS